MNTNKKFINIGILGCVSAGKSTLLNSIFGKSLSDMKIKRTTMIPQVYNLKKCINNDINDIVISNKQSNDEFNSKLWDGQTINEYRIEHPNNFVDLDDDYEFKITDMPGINDQQTKNIYTTWLMENIAKFHFVIYIIDVNSALNTSDEIEILDLITNHISDKCHLICLINKLDNQVCELNANNDTVFHIDDEELDDIINTQIKPTIEKKIFEKNFSYHIQTFASKKCYLYRCLDVDHDVDSVIHNYDPKHIESLMIEEIGKAKWSRTKTEEKIILAKKKIFEIISNKGDENEITNALNDSGYNCMVGYITNTLANNTNFYNLYYEESFGFTLDNYYKSISCDDSHFLKFIECIKNVSRIHNFICDTELDTRIYQTIEQNLLMHLCETKFDNKLKTTDTYEHECEKRETHMKEYIQEQHVERHYKQLELERHENQQMNRKYKRRPMSSYDRNPDTFDERKRNILSTIENEPCKYETERNEIIQQYNYIHPITSDTTHKDTLIRCINTYHNIIMYVVKYTFYNDDTFDAIIEKIEETIISILKQNKPHTIGSITELICSNIPLYKKFKHVTRIIIENNDFEKNSNVSVNEHVNYIKMLYNNNIIEENDMFSMMYSKMDIVLSNIMDGFHNEKIFNDNFDLGTNQLNNYAGIFILVKQLENNKNEKQIIPIYYALNDMLLRLSIKYNISLNIHQYSLILEFMDEHQSNILDDIFSLVHDREVVVDSHSLNCNDINAEDCVEHKGNTIVGWFKKIF